MISEKGMSLGADRRQIEKRKTEYSTAKMDAAMGNGRQSLQCCNSTIIMRRTENRMLPSTEEIMR